jgi:ABC-2 type transport system permease protein
MTVFSLTLRALLFRGRTLGLALLPLIVGLGAVGAAIAVPERNIEDVYSAFSANLALSLVVALVSLVIGVNAFDDEREGGTLPLLMATATPRWRIVVAKLLAAWLTAVIVCIPALLGCAVLGASTSLSAGPLLWHLFLAVVLGSGGYTGLFVLLSLLSQRGLLIGLAYVVIWEGSLATYTKALRDLSVGAYAKRILASGYGPGSVPFTFSDAGPWVAAVCLVGLGLLCAVLASLRLPRMDISH